ncbi:MAG: hypothetical protein ABFS24_14120 [Pseudomonadota bacterium]
MNMPRKLNNWVAVFLFAIYLVIPGTNIAAPPDEIPPIVQDVSDRIDALEAFVRRLHGNKAAAVSRSIDIDTSGSVSLVQFILTYCIGPGPGGPGSANFCRFSDADYTLTTGEFFDEDSDGEVITFNANNSPNFTEVVNLLTNGGDDRMGVTLALVKPNNVFFADVLSGPERFAFFIQPQTSSGIGYDDLEGFEIDEISISIDFIGLSYDENEDKSRVSINMREFFGLAD